MRLKQFFSARHLAALFATGLVLVTASPAHAIVIYNYSLENTGGGYQPDFSHVFGQAVYDTHPAAIHGNLGGGASDHFAVTEAPAWVRFHVDETNGKLLRYEIEGYAAAITGVEVDYNTGKVSPGAQGVYNRVQLSVDVDLSGNNTEVLLGANSRQTGELSVRLQDASSNIGTLTASGPGVASQDFRVGVMVSPDPVNCSVCLGVWGDYGDILGPVADFKALANGTFSPIFSTWMPIYGSNASFDLNGYLVFRGASDLAEVPEPATMGLLGMALAGLGAVRRKEKIVP